VTIALPLAYAARDEHSGMIQMTRPTHGRTFPNSSIGTGPDTCITSTIPPLRSRASSVPAR
jgi:hypothetical protein